MFGEILIWIMVVARIVIGVTLTRVALRQNTRNLLWLAVVFYVNGLFNVFYTQLLFNPFLLQLGFLPAQVCLVLFIHQTFYRDRPSPWGIFMAISVVGGLATLASIVSRSLKLEPSIFIYAVLACNWLWHTVIAYQAYDAVVKDRSVEDWVKARYRLMIAYSSLMILVALVGILAILWVPLSGALQGLVGLITISSIMLQYLVWVMPEGFRQWLNRDYQPPAFEAAELEQSEDEILRQLRAE